MMSLKLMLVQAILGHWRRIYENTVTGEMSVVAPSAVRFGNELGGDVVTCAYNAGMLFLQTYAAMS